MPDRDSRAIRSLRSPTPRDPATLMPVRSALHAFQKFDAIAVGVAHATRSRGDWVIL
jgi:hypothetical protein